MFEYEMSVLNVMAPASTPRLLRSEHNAAKRGNNHKDFGHCVEVKTPSLPGHVSSEERKAFLTQSLLELSGPGAGFEGGRHRELVGE
jgi:hypothetical protein